MCSRTVVLGSHIQILSCHNNTIAAGSKSGDIIILNPITGSQTAVLSGHTDEVTSITFSSHGTSLVSGSDDETVKLWDVQTGGITKTFSGHTGSVMSVSMSADDTIIASGSIDETIRLWNIQTGECYHTINHQDIAFNVSFFPTDPQYILSTSYNKIWQWNTDGHQIKPMRDGSHITFSSDGTQLVSCNETVVTVQDFNSGAIVAEFQAATSEIYHCYFSPDSRFIAITTDDTAYIWDITDSNPHLVETFTGHTGKITSIAFSSSSSLISASEDGSIKFWQISSPLIDPAMPGSDSTLLTSALIQSIALQTKDGITITSDSDGVVKVWDILTGSCKESFQTPAKDASFRDVCHRHGHVRT